MLIPNSTFNVMEGDNFNPHPATVPTGLIAYHASGNRCRSYRTHQQDKLNHLQAIIFMPKGHAIFAERQIGLLTVPWSCKVLFELTPRCVP